ncbi:outer membrane beta-barrel protein [Nostoc ellipsosporum NOK]|nr:outer membrane beta-barrel protein [Nostoc ellipsosporum NOK]
MAADIRKKKRRRVLAFFLFFFLLLSGVYAGMQFFSAGADKHDTITRTQTPSGDNAATHTQPYIPSTGQAVAKEPGTGQPVANTANTPIITNATAPRAITRTVYSSGKAKNKKQPLAAQPALTPAANNSNDQPVAGNDIPAQQPIITTNNNQLPAIEPAATAVNTPGLSATPADTLAANGALTALSAAPVDSVATATSVTKTKNKKSWRWGVEGGIGMAGVLSAPFSMKAAEPAQAVLNNGITQQASVLMPGTVTYLPGGANPFLAWNLGAVVEKQFTRRSSFSAGLRYSYLSTTQKAGEYNPTFRANVGEPKNDYINSFHFISLPLTYHWQINQARKLPPVTFDIGFTASRLLSTNALLYSVGQGGIYYKDQRLFNKNHFDLTAGFSVRLNAGGRWQWSLGPQAGFDLTNLYLDKAGQDKEFLYYGGLKLRLLLPQR